MITPFERRMIVTEIGCRIRNSGRHAPEMRKAEDEMLAYIRGLERAGHSFSACAKIAIVKLKRSYGI